MCFAKFSKWSLSDLQSHDHIYQPFFLSQIAHPLSLKVYIWWHVKIGQWEWNLNGNTDLIGYFVKSQIKFYDNGCANRYSKQVRFDSHWHCHKHIMSPHTPSLMHFRAKPTSPSSSPSWSHRCSTIDKQLIYDTVTQAESQWFWIS